MKLTLILIHVFIIDFAEKPGLNQLILLRV